MLFLIVDVISFNVNDTIVLVNALADKLLVFLEAGFHHLPPIHYRKSFQEKIHK